VTIDDLFDLTAEQRLRRIEHRLDTEEEISTDIFREYEEFLLGQLMEHADRAQVLSLLARLYHHRMNADAGRVSKYAREAILLKPEKKDCQWLLQKAEGHAAWDWNIANHTEAIEFYKDVIEHDRITPQTPLSYYYLIDNLIADHRTQEARDYLEICRTLPAHRPFLIPVYRAHIALAEFDEAQADAIMEEALREFPEDSGFLFELAQFYALKCAYEKAIAYYEASWAAEEDQKPRFTDALEGIAMIYELQGNHGKAAETYDRVIACLKDEWGCTEDDAYVRRVDRKRKHILQK
jgi:tetratricopeptide (TPR) repeat protein